MINIQIFLITKLDLVLSFFLYFSAVRLDKIEMIFFLPGHKLEKDCERHTGIQP